MELRKVKLGEICNVNARSIQKDSFEGDIQYLDTSNLTEGTISQLQEIAIAKAPSRAQRLVSDETILFSMVRPNQKHFGILSNPPENMVVSTGFATLDIKDKTHYYPAYVYYLLTQESVVNYLQTLAEGSVSAYPSINPSDIANISFAIPEYTVQRKIGKLLSDIDRKIALNRRMNATLEAMARQLYDYWFVQFDFPDAHGKPYKSSGGKMTWNNQLKRDIPEGWSVERLDDICVFRNGINYSKDERGSQYKIVNVRNISSTTILLDNEDFDVITVPQKRAINYILKPEDIIIARSGCPGSPRLLLTSNDVLFCGFIICCSPIKQLIRNYLFYCLKQLEGTNATISGGSILKNVSQDTLKEIHTIVPADGTLYAFNKITENLFSKMLACAMENKKLTRLRATLLPLLMNGQVGVE